MMLLLVSVIIYYYMNTFITLHQCIFNLLFALYSILSICHSVIICIIIIFVNYWASKIHEK